jgi:DNA-binding CsgD family transcriptional regulator
MGLDAVLGLVRQVLTQTPPLSGSMEAPSKLTRRERDLIVLVAQGLTDAEIAQKLFISIRTVRSHLDRIKDKTGVRRRAELTRLAMRQGLA